MGGLGGGDDFFLRGVGPAIGDILPHGALPQPAFLQHHAKQRPHAVALHMIDAFAIDENIPCIDFVKTHQQVHQRGFASPCGPHDGHLLAGLHLQLHILDQGPLGRIAKAYVGEGDVSPHMGGGDRVRRIRLLVFRIQEVHDAVQSRQGGLQLGHHGADFIEGLGILIGIGEAGGNAADAHDAQATAQGDQPAGYAHGHIHQVIHKPGDGVDQRAVKLSAIAAGFQPAVDFVKGGYGVFLLGKHQRQLLIARPFADKGGQLALGFALLPEQMMGAAGNLLGHQNGQGREHQHHQRHPHVNGQQEDHRAHDGGHAGHQLAYALKQAVAHSFRIRRHPGHDVAVRRAVNGLERHLMNLGKRRIPQIPHRAIAYHVGAIGQQPLERRRQQIHRQQQPDNPQKGREIHMAFHDHVNPVAYQQRGKQPQPHAHHRGQKRRDQGHPAFFQIGQQPLQALLFWRCVLLFHLSAASFSES